jgi:hypothetical protein
LKYTDFVLEIGPQKIPIGRFMGQKLG